MRIFFIFSCIGLALSIQNFDELPKFASEDTPGFLERNKERVPILLNEGVSPQIISRFEHLEELVVFYRLKDNKDVSASVIIALFKGKSKVQEKRRLAEGENLITDIEKLILVNYPKNFIRLDKDNVQFYLAKYVVDEKKPVIVLYETPGEKSVVFRAICNASEFSEVQFFIWSEELTAMNHYLKLENVPAVVYFTLPEPVHSSGDEAELKKSGMQVKKMPGTISYTKVIMFLRYILNERKNIQEVLEKQRNEKVFEDSIVIIGDGRSGFLESELKSCFSTYCLLFFDRVTKKEKESFNKITRDLKKVQSKFPKEKLKVILIDGICHLNIMKALSLKETEMPSAVIYTSYKNSKFMILQTVHPDDIIGTMNHIDSEYMVWQKQTEPFKFRSETCMELNEQYEARLDQSKAQNQSQKETDL